MRFIPRFTGRRFEIVFLAGIAVACSSGGAPGGSPSSGGNTGGAMAPASGGSSTSSGGALGSGGAGGGSGGSVGNAGSGGTSPPADAQPGPVADAGSTPVVDVSGPSDAGSGPAIDTGAGDGHPFADSGTPMNVPGSPPPSYEGEIPIYYGPEVGPIVQMQCPGDPTAGWTEYQDTFHLERPYNVPHNMRFNITDGIYNFVVFPNDRPHSPIAMGRNPRTEATYGGLRDKENAAKGTGVSKGIGYFTTGMRMYSADMLLESSANGSAIMQIHTTAAGGGPIGLRLQGNNLVNNGSLTVVNGSTVPGGIVNKWFNFKASFDTATRQVQIFINNCLKSTYTGPRGDGHYYFKNGVYFCDAGGGCRTHFKNIHLYEK